MYRVVSSIGPYFSEAQHIKHADIVELTERGGVGREVHILTRSEGLPANKPFDTHFYYVLQWPSQLSFHRCQFKC